MKKIVFPIANFIILMLLCRSIGVDALSVSSVTPPTDILPTINADTPGSAIAEIIQFFILMTGVLAVMAITWGGIGLILSTGDDEKMKKSRKTIIYAFVGVVVAGLAYGIVEVITRMDLTGLAS